MNKRAAELLENAQLALAKGQRENPVAMLSELVRALDNVATLDLDADQAQGIHDNVQKVLAQGDATEADLLQQIAVLWPLVEARALKYEGLERIATMREFFQDITQKGGR